MPRFFLDVLNGGELREDPEGQEFVALDAARAEAVASARYLVAQGILRNEDASDRSFIIRNEGHEAVATVPTLAPDAASLELGSGCREPGAQAGVRHGLGREHARNGEPSVHRGLSSTPESSDSVLAHRSVLSTS